jgi:hypothetical protein
MEWTQGIGKDDMASNVMVGAVLLALANPSLSSLIVRLVPSTPTLLPWGLSIGVFLQTKQ